MNKYRFRFYKNGFMEVIRTYQHSDSSIPEVLSSMTVKRSDVTSVSYHYAEGFAFRLMGDEEETVIPLDKIDDLHRDVHRLYHQAFTWFTEDFSE